MNPAIARPDIVSWLASVVADVLRDPQVQAAVREILKPETPSAPPPDPAGTLLGKIDLAKRLSVSVSTIDRLSRQGLPVAAHVGDSRRYDLDECKAWLSQRGKQPTTIKPATRRKTQQEREEDEDLDAIAASSGLRRVHPGDPK